MERASRPAAPPTDSDIKSWSDHRGVCTVASGNGLRATERAMALLGEGYDPADCVVQGVRIIEDDPADTSVGYGGLPNEEGIVELDACVMHGPTHKSGAVASLRNVKNPAWVALHVLRRTDHCLLVGEGALKFARRCGFKEEDLLTEASRREWLTWKENMSKSDDYLNDDERDDPVGKEWHDPDSAGGLGRQRAENSNSRPRDQPWLHHTGTVHCAAVTSKGDVASCTSTSGLSWKIPGRVGDSPIIGAGNYCDNEIGSAGCTGRGEAVIVNLASFDIVQKMAAGMTPAEACMAVAKRVAEHCIREKRNRDGKGRPNFNVSFYAMRKDGAFGGASILPGGSMAVHDGKAAKVFAVPALYES